MIRKLRNRHFFIFDSFLIIFLPFLALSLRVSTPWSVSFVPDLMIFVLAALVIKLPIFYAFGLYRRYWPFASIDSMVSIIAGVVLSSAAVAAVFFLLNGLGLLGLPRSIPFIDGMLTLILVGGIRFSARLLSHTSQHKSRNGEENHHVIIAGAGEAGQMVAREILSSRYVEHSLVGFVDDDPDKIGTTIHGVQVLGPLKSIPAQVKKYKIDEVIIAMPAAPGEIIRRIVQACEAANVRSRTLPGIYELLSGQVSIKRLREVEINDLLRREPVNIDPSQVQRLLSGKTVLVTGAGGSIGTELCVQIATCKPLRLVALGHGENSLHWLQSRFNTARLQDCPLEIIVADIRDRHRLQLIFQEYHPEIVFHAAAHKHVPLMEANLEDAVTNNVVGTWNLVNAAQAHGVNHFVLISTDKAVQPVNIMGMTKRIAELIVRKAAADNGLPYVCVRFGNVLGSRGSVIPIFKQQIAAGGPVTVTHPEVERYFMTIPEAVQLVLQASALGENGEVFVLDMGKPIKIKDLAKDMIELSGYEVGRDIEIRYTGLRPGERLNELLFGPSERRDLTRHEKIFVARNGVSPSLHALDEEIAGLKELAETGEKDQLRQKLVKLTSSLE
jgi:FlaA1/EpsC-like NDP-sugar epimerase